jgi:hypothetical protein
MGKETAVRTAIRKPRQLTFSRSEAARDRLFSSSPSESDGVLALRLADYFVADGPPYRLFVVGRNAPRKACFTSNDEEAARAWIIQSALAGLCVMHAPGGGFGTLAQIREQLRAASR